MRKTLRVLAAHLLTAAMLCSVSAGAVEAEENYIVKYREGTAEASDRFDVVSAREMRRLRRAGMLEWYEQDGDAILLDGPSAPRSAFYADEQWNLERIGADAAFRRNQLGQGVRVGVLDSGVEMHPALEERLVQGRSYVEDAPEDDTSDYYGHGTRIAGLIAAAGEDGYVGVAPAAEIVPLKVTDGKAVKVSVLCEAIYDAVDEFSCDVLNLSMGVRTDYSALREAVTYAEERGVTVFSAAGNDGNDTLYYPAGYDTVIGVGAVDGSGTHYSRSNHNESVFLTAPGTDVRSTSARGGYESASGTSFSVPQASAAAAVLLGIDGDLTPAAIRTLLAQGARDAGEAGYDVYYGYGILNIAEAIAALSDGAAESRSTAADAADPTEGGEAPQPQQAYAEGEACPLRAFSDLDEAAWYHDGVRFVLENGWMSGYEGGVFLPDAPTSRAMLVTILWRIAGKPAADGPVTFADVPQGSWCEDAVRWAAANGVAGGYTESVFGPNDPVTREQFAAILYRYIRTNGGFDGAWEERLDFADADAVSPWGREAMCRLTAAGIIQGTGGGMLSPKGSATRAQIATMLMRYAARGE